MSIIDLHANMGLIELSDAEQAIVKQYQKLAETIKDYDLSIRVSLDQQYEIDDANRLLTNYQNGIINNANQCAREEISNLIENLKENNIICQVLSKLYFKSTLCYHMIEPPKTKQDLINYCYLAYKMHHVDYNQPKLRTDANEAYNLGYTYVENFITRNQYNNILSELISNDKLRELSTIEDTEIMIKFDSPTLKNIIVPHMTNQQYDLFVKQFHAMMTFDYKTYKKCIYNCCKIRYNGLMWFRNVINNTPDEKFTNDVKVYAAIHNHFNSLCDRFKYCIQGCWEPVEELKQLQSNSIISKQYFNLFQKLNRNEEYAIDSIHEQLNQQLKQIESHRNELKQNLELLEPKRNKCKQVNKQLQILDESLKQIKSHDIAKDWSEAINLSRLIVEVDELRKLLQ